MINVLVISIFSLYILFHLDFNIASILILYAEKQWGSLLFKKKNVLNVVWRITILKVCSSFFIFRKKCFTSSNTSRILKKKININSYYFSLLSTFDLNNLISNTLKFSLILKQIVCLFLALIFKYGRAIY